MERETRGERKGVGEGGEEAAPLPRHRKFVLDTSAKFSIWKSDTAEIKKNRQGMSRNNRRALHKQMSHRGDGDSFTATFVQGFWCRLGVFVGSINKIQ